jgi:alpha-glucosidase (family GH31 glycosyl hydrolase)
MKSGLLSLLIALVSGSELVLHTSRGETIKIEPFGLNALRVRVNPTGKPINDTLPGALIAPTGQEPGADQFISANSLFAVTGNTVTNGNIAASVDQSSNLITVIRVSDGKVLLKEASRLWNGTTATLAFASTRAESIYGFGEHQQGKLNMKGSKFDMETCLDYGHSKGGEVCLPFIIGGTGPHTNCKIGTSHGCFQDSNSRIMPGRGGAINQNLTLEICASECSSKGYHVIGVESGTQCYCGGAIPDSSHKIDDSKCNSACEGDKSENCGGAWAMTVHELNCTTVGSAGSLQYGFLWNMPNYGGVSFGDAETAWTAQEAAQLDYFISTFGESSAGTAQAGADILHSYVDATGHTPMLPDYAAGYWHSKNRYSSQHELLTAAAGIVYCTLLYSTVLYCTLLYSYCTLLYSYCTAAEGFHNRSIPVDIIVIDYHHWANMGDWSFDASKWPDVPAMMSTLDGYGMKVGTV